jgi:hypothetical protein
VSLALQPSLQLFLNPEPLRVPVGLGPRRVPSATMAPAPAEPADPASPSALPDSGPTLPEPPTRGGNFFHGLLGLSAGRFSETVRQSIPALAKQKNHGVLMGSAAAESPPSCSTTPEPKDECKGSGSRRPPNREPRHLLSLPPEILLMILRHLGFADIVRLRWTCKQLHAFANPQQLRTLFGPEQLRLQLLSHCKVCLRYDQFRTHLLHSTQMDQGYPLSRRCIDCAIKARDPRIRVGRKVLLGDYASVWVCRWCGFPIVEGAAFGYEQMHRKCYRHYNDVLFVFFILGWIQLTLGIVAAALSWKYYRHSTIVFAPTVVSFPRPRSFIQFCFFLVRRFSSKCCF